jgi:phage terminase large subunit-like protein
MKDVIDFAISRFGSRELGLWSDLSTEGRRLFLAEWFKRDFRSLIYMLGYKTLGKLHDKEVEALSQIRVLDEKTPIRQLWLWSRGFFKTTLITECHSVYLIINNPNIRMLLGSNTISVSEDMMRNIKGHLMSNVAFRHFYPEFCPKPNTVGKIEFGTNQDFTVPCRTVMLKEPTMMVAGVGTNLTGLHFDYMKLDDLVTKDSVTNDTQLQASKDYYASLRPLFDKAAVPREDVVGTIYHFNDLYSSVLKPSKLFKESFIPARIKGVPTFPERLPDDELDKLVSDPSVGPWQFATQYMLNPINPADAKFKEEWIKYYHKLPEGLAEYILVDPASTVKKKSDYTVIQRWGVDDKGNAYLLEGVRDKLTAFARIDKLFEIVSHSKNLKWVKYEVIGGRHGDLEEIERRQVDAVQKNIRGYRRFNVKETKATAATKVDRIEQRLVGQYHAGKVFLPEHSYFISKFDGKVQDFVQLLKLEYLQFPFTEHDDILDCQAQLYEEHIIKGSKQQEVKQTSEFTAAHWDKMYEEMRIYGNKYPDLSTFQIQAMIANKKLGKRLMKVSYGRK